MTAYADDKFAQAALKSEVNGQIAAFETKVANGEATVVIKSDNFNLTEKGEVTSKKFIMEQSEDEIIVPDNKNIAWFSFEKVNDVLSPVLYWKYNTETYFLNMSNLIQKKIDYRLADTIYTIDKSSNNIKVLKPIKVFQQCEINSDGSENLVPNKYYTLSSTGKYSPLSKGVYYKSHQITKGSILPNNFTVSGGGGATTQSSYNCCIFVEIGVYGRYNYENDTMQTTEEVKGGDNFIIVLSSYRIALNSTLKSQTTENLLMTLELTLPQYTILDPSGKIFVNWFHKTVDDFSNDWQRAAIYASGREVSSSLSDYINRNNSNNYYTGLFPYTGDPKDLIHHSENKIDTEFRWLDNVPPFTGEK